MLIENEKKSKNTGKKILLIILIIVNITLSFSIMYHMFFSGTTIYTQAAKPVIYFYPEEEMDIFVSLEYNGELTHTYPKYDEGWNIKAYPDGTIYHNEREYSYLFWEGDTYIEYDLSKGFVVKGDETMEFLQEKLEYLGLTPKEYNEFIVYWLPFMENNKYNLITFQEECYTDNAILNIEPKPDSIQRVFMVFSALDYPIEFEEQILQPFERSGYSVIEWGGTEVIY